MIAVIILTILAIALVIARQKSEAKEIKNDTTVVSAPADPWKGAFSAYGQALERIKKSPIFVLVLSLATLGGYILSLMLQGNPSPGEEYIPFEYVVILPLLLALPAYSLAVASGKKPSVSSLYRRPLRIFAYLILAGVLTELIVLGSFLLLIVPFIWTVAWFFAAGYVVVDKNVGPITALKESKRLARQHKGKVWGVIGVSLLFSLGMSMFAIIPGVGFYIMMAVSGALSVWSSVAGAILYVWLQKNVPVSEKAKADDQK